MFSCHGDSGGSKSFTSCSHCAQFVVCKARRSHTDGAQGAASERLAPLGSLLLPGAENPCPSGDVPVASATTSFAASEETPEQLLITIDPGFQVFRREAKTTHPRLRGATVSPRLCDWITYASVRQPPGIAAV